MADLYVGRAEEFEDRDRKIVAQGTLEIGVFHVGGEFYAYENNCVHQGGPVCQGRILNRVVEMISDDKTSQGLAWSEDDVHIVCPWHGYEFNLRTGVHPGYKNARLRPFDVKLKDGEVYVVT